MNLQESITDFESQFSGPYPFASAGVFVGTPPASFEEEMQTMIAFAGGIINTDLLYHENMHQWWGDNVTEAGYNVTFYKEGLATLAEDLYSCEDRRRRRRRTDDRRGTRRVRGPPRRSIQHHLRVDLSIWTGAPSNPTPATLSRQLDTYIRPEAAYIALRKILGAPAFDAALQTHPTRARRRQHRRGATRGCLPPRDAEHAAACGSERLDAFFAEWFDTAYPSGGGINRPQITAARSERAGFLQLDRRL